MLAALLNAAKLTGKQLEDLDVLVVGLGAAGDRGREDPARAPACTHDHRLRLARARCHTDRADYQDGSMTADQALVRRGHQPGAARTAARPT